MARFQATLQAAQKNQSTGIQLVRGKVYRFTSEGTWLDWNEKATAIGYNRPWLAPFKPLRRFAKAKWFSVIGSIDKRKSTRFDIGLLIEKQETYTATASGELFCFANDISLMYWNNSGSIQLFVDEL